MSVEQPIYPHRADHAAMPERLDGKVAVVTGGGAHSERVFGIGEATCKLFAEEGANVVVVDVSQEMVDRTVDAINDEDTPRAIGVETDITDEGAVKELASVCEAEFGQVDILVNNAGIRVDPGPITDFEEDEWDAIFDVNLKGMANCSKHLIPLMQEAGGGSIVNIASGNAELGRPGWSLYDATKSGVLGLTRDMACDHASDNIRVNSVLPGSIVTDYHIESSVFDQDEVDDVDEFIEQETTPDPDSKFGILKRRGHPREIANGILFLASDEASFVTGNTLNVDGGIVAGGYTAGYE